MATGIAPSFPSPTPPPSTPTHTAFTNGKQPYAEDPLGIAARGLNVNANLRNLATFLQRLVLRGIKRRYEDDEKEQEVSCNGNDFVPTAVEPDGETQISELYKKLKFECSSDQRRVSLGPRDFSAHSHRPLPQLKICLRSSQSAPPENTSYASINSYLYSVHEARHSCHDVNKPGGMEQNAQDTVQVGMNEYLRELHFARRGGSGRDLG